MVFPNSINPLYLDPPIWHQQQSNQLLIHGINPSTTTTTTTHEHHHNSNLAPQPVHVVGGTSSSIRPGSLADRARSAKIPQPEVALKCPRCESTNTKFCYFNNYNRSQPRHFCKTCRRYWTRGGALRNVPVGGGCRRNKKNKNSSGNSTNGNGNSKSSMVSSIERKLGSSSISEIPNNSEIIGHQFASHQQATQYPFLGSLPNANQYSTVGNLGMNFGGMHGIGTTTCGGGSGGQTHDLGFHIGTSSGVVQHFPFFEPQPSLFMAAGSSMVGDSHIRSMSSSSRISQLEPVLKGEETQGSVLPRQLLSNMGNHNQYWTDLSSLSSSSTPHLL